MRMALRRAGWALVTAGTLGFVLPATAQRPFDPPGHPLTEATGEEGSRADGHSRLIEIKVELALMTDRSTFPYRFGPHVKGDTLELRGFVPDEVVRQRALTIATENSTLPVVDALRLHPRRAVPPLEIPPEQLRGSALAVLQEAFPEHSRQFTVQVQAEGEVTVAGPIPSYEEKVAVGHCLRNVRGCGAVNNQLSAAGFCGGKACPFQHATSQRLVSPEGPGAEPVFRGNPPPTAQAFEAKKVTPPPPVFLGPSVEPMASPWSPPAPKPEADHSIPVQRPAQSARPATVNVAVAAPSPQPFDSNFHPALRPGPRGTDSNWKPSSTQVVASTSPSPAPLSSIPVKAPEVEKVSWPSHPEILPPITREMPVVPAPVMTPAANPVVKAEAPLPKPVAVQPTIPLALPPTTWSQAKATPPAPWRAMTASAPCKPPVAGCSGKPVQTVKASPPASAKPTAAAVSSRPVATPAPRQDLTVLPVRLKKCIEGTCGATAHDVQVVVQSPTTMLVRLKVPSRVEGERLSDKIFQMPELGPYQVNLEVKVAR